jgi:uncharacterized protein YchJ
MKSALSTLLVFLIVLAVLMVLGSALFMGFGSLLTRWFPLSLFQASGLAIGATLAFAAIIHVLSTIMRAQQISQLNDDFDDEEGDDDDDADLDLPDNETVFPAPDFSKVARNDYCPCGSGKKFKNCCLTQTVK